MAERISCIDNMKAMGIVLVVLGHCESLEGEAKTLIYAFHMPLFFLLSGLLMSEKKLGLPMRAFLKTQFHALIVPYLFYFSLSVAFWTAKTSVFPDGHTLTEALAGLFWGYGDRLFVNPPLWFFPCLFVTTVLYYLLRRAIPSSLLLTAACVSLSMIGLSVFPLPEGRLPWSIENAIVALMFYAFGVACQSIPAMVQRFSRSSLIVLTVVTFALMAGMALINGRVDLNGLLFGHSILLFPLAALAGICGCLFLGVLLPPTQIARWLSENTIVIFTLHGPISQVITAFFVVVFHFHRDFNQQHWAWSIVYTVAAILVCWPISYAFRFVAPGLSGVRRKQQVLAHQA